MGIWFSTPLSKFADLKKNQFQSVLSFVLNYSNNITVCFATIQGCIRFWLKNVLFFGTSISVSCEKTIMNPTSTFMCRQTSGSINLSLLCFLLVFLGPQYSRGIRHAPCKSIQAGSPGYHWRWRRTYNLQNLPDSYTPKHPQAQWEINWQTALCFCSSFCSWNMHFDSILQYLV